MTQDEFNTMLQIAIAQGLPGGTYQSKYSRGEDIDKALDGGVLAGVTAVKNRAVTVEASQLKNYLNQMPRLITENLHIKVTGELTENVNLGPFFGPGSIVIDGLSEFVMYETLNISSCNLKIIVQSMTFDGSRRAGPYSQTITSYSRTVMFSGCNFQGGAGPGSVVSVNSNGSSGIMLYNTNIKNTYLAVSAQDGSIISVDGKTSVFSGNAVGASVYNGIIMLSPRVPEMLGAASHANNAGIIVGPGGKLF